MTEIFDKQHRYGAVSRLLHWGMALLFAAQFLSAAAHWALPRENALRDTLWGYHTNLGITLFLLVLVRGCWGLVNLSRRPKHAPDAMGRAAVAGHLALYALMVIVPILKIIASAGGKRGLSYLGITIFPAREAVIAWTQALGEWHGTLAWVLGLLVVGHIAVAVIWHRMMKKDDVLKRMA